MNRAKRFRLHLFKVAVVVAFVAGVALLGTSWSIYTERGCFGLATPSHCARARWTMLIGALLAIGAIVALWRRTVRRKRT